MALKSIAKKQEEIRAAKAGLANAPSEGKSTLTRVRLGMMVGWLACLFGAFLIPQLGYLFGLFFVLWIVLLFAGLFVK